MPLLWPEGQDGLYRIKLEYSYGGKPCLNVFWYESFALGASASSLLDAWGPVWEAVIESLSTVIVESTVTVTSMADFSDEDTSYSNVLVGLRTGTPTKPLTAWGYRFVSTTRLVHDGGKRFAGVSESDLDNYGVPTATYEAIGNALADLLDDPVTDAGKTYYPVIISPENTRHEENIVLGFSTCQFIGSTTQRSRR